MDPPFEEVDEGIAPVLVGGAGEEDGCGGGGVEGGRGGVVWGDDLDWGHFHCFLGFQIDGMWNTN